MLIIDVQSSVVRGALVHSHQSGIPSIIYTHDVSIPYKPHTGSSYLIKMVLRGIQEINEAVRSNLSVSAASGSIPGKVSSVHFVLSSPWVVSQAKTISLSFKDDTSINRAFIADVVAGERKKMSANADDIRVIEEKVFDVRLNGYSVSSWESRHTRELGVSFVVSIAGGRMIDKFIQEVSSVVHKTNRIHFHSSIFLQHLGIQKTMPRSDSYALIHVHGELTDVALVREGFCTFFGSYPFGVQHIIRTVASEMKTSEANAESMLDLVMKKDVDTAHARKEAQIIANMKQGWVSELKKLLKTSPTPEAIPAKVIISARLHEEFFMESFRLAYPRSTPEHLDIENILPYVSYGTHADRLRLTGLYVAAIHTLIS